MSLPRDMTYLLKKNKLIFFTCSMSIRRVHNLYSCHQLLPVMKKKPLGRKGLKSLPDGPMDNDKFNKNILTYSNPQEVFSPLIISSVSLFIHGFACSYIKNQGYFYFSITIPIIILLLLLLRLVFFIDIFRRLMMIMTKRKNI